MGPSLPKQESPLADLDSSQPQQIENPILFKMPKPVPMPPFSRTWLYLVGINLVVLAIDMVACAGFTYIPPLLLKMGFSLTSMSIITGLGPMVSLFLVPVIGRSSDKSTKCTNKRMPYIIGLSALLMASIVLIPFAEDMGKHLHLGFAGVYVVVSCGVILLDFATQALLNPCKAWISDVLIECNSSENGFMIYSCMLSLGGCLGYYLTSLNWEKGKFGEFVGGQEKTVFLILGVLFFGLSSLSLILGMRYSNQNTRLKNNNNDVEMIILCVKKQDQEHHVKIEESELIQTLFVFIRKPSVLFKMLFKTLWYPVKCCFYYGALPPALFRLFLTDLFSWMALHCHDIYFADFVGKVIFQGYPEEGKGRIFYDEGVRWGSWGLLLRSSSAVFYAAFVQDKLISQFGQRATYLFGMATFTLSMMVMLYSRSLFVLQLASVVSGFGATAVTTIPYAILTEYCKYPQVYYPGSPVSSRGVGENMAVLDAASYAAQVLPALFMGFLVDLCGSASVYVIISALCGAVASLLGFFLRYPDRPASK